MFKLFFDFFQKFRFQRQSCSHQGQGLGAVTLLIRYVVLLQGCQGIILTYAANAYFTVPIYCPESRGLVLKPSLHLKSMVFKQVLQNNR